MTGFSKIYNVFYSLFLFHADVAVLNVLFLEGFALSEVPKFEDLSATQEPIVVSRVDVHFIFSNGDMSP